MVSRKSTKSAGRKSSKKASTSSSKKTSISKGGNAPGSNLPQTDPDARFFTPETLDKTVIAIPLLETLKAEKLKLEESKKRRPGLHPVIIDLNLEYPYGREKAREWVIETTADIIKKIGQPTAKIYRDDEKEMEKGKPKEQGIDVEKSADTDQYLFGRLEGRVIRELVRRDSERKRVEEDKDKSANETIGMVVGPRALYHIWPDFPIKLFVNRSVSTVKADAARFSFSAYGEGIVWAVLDSGIDAIHPHFKRHDNLNVKLPLKHQDFTDQEDADAKKDPFGHGTHVAGIIAGEIDNRSLKEEEIEDRIRAYSSHRDNEGNVTFEPIPNLEAISGMAPKCKLLSMKVADDLGRGNAGNLIRAIARIQKHNGHGLRLLIHGVNMSLGYGFDPEWFACGQSPLCVEVNRLVRSGVVVVVSAGNSGYGRVATEFEGPKPAGLDLTIDDPGNAELAITVGSTHKASPHVYGVSYFSSKGPTGDGRLKPDLVAPGEKILSCASTKKIKELSDKGVDCNYMEQSGTSMAAPHVSGVIAAFLSVRQEFIGQPERVKEIFLSTATDLKRERYFQGHGLVDLMRAIQSV
jgi:serine protease AprX